jgi:nucleoside-triphosphatase THEP1
MREQNNSSLLFSEDGNLEARLKELELIKDDKIKKITNNELLPIEDKVKDINVINLLYHRDTARLRNQHLTKEESKEQTSPKVEPTPPKELVIKDSKIDSDLFEGIYIQGIHPKPPSKKPFVTFKNQNFLSSKNLSLIVAPPGSGKSSICESILASMLNKDCDSLGFKIDEEEVKTALFFDGERDFDLVDSSTNRMHRRAKTQSKEGVKPLIIGLRETFKVEDKKKKIVQLVAHYKPQLVIIDGMGDLVKSANSEEESNELYLWAMELITTYSLSILGTIHSNYGTEKARGHLGSELLRRCEGVVYVKVNGEGENTTKTISATKHRQSEAVKHSFKWNKEEGNNVSCEDPTTGVVKKPPLIEALTKVDLLRLKESFSTGKDGKEVMFKIVGGEFPFFTGEYTLNKFSELEQSLKAYLKENHPELNGGTNAIGNLIKDLTLKGHLLKIGEAPKTQYTFTSNSKDKRLSLLNNEEVLQTNRRL